MPCFYRMLKKGQTPFQQIKDPTIYSSHDIKCDLFYPGTQIFLSNDFPQQQHKQQFFEWKDVL